MEMSRFRLEMSRVQVGDAVGFRSEMSKVQIRDE